MKSHFRRMIAMFLVVIMIFPANVFAAETRITQSTKNNVDKIISYANQLRNSSTSNTTSSGFVWDTEKKPYSWSYFNGLMMDAFMDIGGTTNFNFVDTFYNANISSDGSIVNLTEGKVSSGALDFCEPLRATFDLLRTSSRSTKYKRAIQKWYSYLEDQITYPSCGGNYVHKQDDPYTVSSTWAEYPIALDGLYMAQPFLMETANAIDAGILTIKDKNNRTVTSSSIYTAVYNRFVWIYNNLYNSSTGLYDHGYNPSTRRTNGVTWSRSVGWYVMALVDVIDMMPDGSMKNNLIAELPRIFDGLLRYQDSSGLWYNVTAYDSSLWGKNQNILETSGTSMFAYAMVKATQKSFVTDPKYYTAAVKAFNGVVTNKLKGSQGNYSVVDTYKSSGASTDPAYYCNNTYTTNEAKGIGSLIMLAALLKNNSTVGSANEVIPDAHIHSYVLVSDQAGTCIQKGVRLYSCSICNDTRTEETTYGDHSYFLSMTTNGTCVTKILDVYVCAFCQDVQTEEGDYGSHSYNLTQEVAGDCMHKGYKIYTCSYCNESRQAESSYGDHDYRLIADVAPGNNTNGYKTYQCRICSDSYQEIVEPEYEIVEETVTTVTYELATSITPGEKYIMASGYNGNVYIIGNNNGTAFRELAYVSNKKMNMSNKNVSQFLWTFASATSGKISNNGLYVKTSSVAQFNTSGENMAISYRGNGAYYISKTTSAGITSYLNPLVLTEKTTTPTNVYLFKEVVTTTVNRYEVHIEYETTTTTTYERASTIDTNSEYILASSYYGNVNILGHTGYTAYSSDAKVSNNVLTSAFSHANGNDANYLWKFTKANTATNQTSTPVIYNQTAYTSAYPTTYIQMIDRSMIGNTGNAVTVVNKGGFFTMRQGSYYVDPSSAQNSTRSKNIYLFKKKTVTETKEKRVLVKI